MCLVVEGFEFLLPGSCFHTLSFQMRAGVCDVRVIHGLHKAVYACRHVVGASRPADARTKKMWFHRLQHSGPKNRPKKWTPIRGQNVEAQLLRFTVLTPNLVPRFRASKQDRNLVSQIALLSMCTVCYECEWFKLWCVASSARCSAADPASMHSIYLLTRLHACEV